MKLGTHVPNKQIPLQYHITQSLIITRFTVMPLFGLNKQELDEGGFDLDIIALFPIQ